MQIGVSSLPDRVPDPTTTDPGAQTSGPGFDRMIAAAQAEADRRKAIADKSGASADQFTEQSWFAIVKAHGAEIGLGAVAGKITKDSHGQLTVVDPALRAKVINYRNDPLVRSVMAVKRATDGKAVLNSELGRPPSDAEMRAAEAIGAKAAAKLITTRQSTPNASAALVSPEAAMVNRAVFYRPDGSPQTVNEVLVTLMKPVDAPANADANRLAAGHAAFPGPATASAPTGVAAALMPIQGMTPEMAASMRARAALATQDASATAAKQKPARAVPRDLALVGRTIGNLSMPGSATGAAAPTGGKVSGWRAQVAGEVTRHIEHPDSVVANAPSNVTIPAPDPSRRAPVDQYATATSVAAVQPVPSSSSQQLGPQLAPSRAAPQPIPPVAFAPPTANVAQAPAQAPSALPSPVLPSLVAGTPMTPTSALPLLPIDDANAPIMLSPQGSLAPASATPVDAPLMPQAAPIVTRPSRYGPSASLLTPNASSRVLGYAAASPLLQTQAISDAASAGIRPSRYYASAAQQLASMSRPAPQASPIPQSLAPDYSQPLATPPVLGPDGVPILPSVPRPAGLPPITASEALQPGQVDPATQTALLDGTKPLDLAPSAPAPVVASQPTQPLHKAPRPRLTPPSRF